MWRFSHCPHIFILVMQKMNNIQENTTILKADVCCLEVRKRRWFPGKSNCSFIWVKLIYLKNLVSIRYVVSCILSDALPSVSDDGISIGATNTNYRKWTDFISCIFSLIWYETSCKWLLLQFMVSLPHAHRSFFLSDWKSPQVMSALTWSPSQRAFVTFDE